MLHFLTFVIASLSLLAAAHTQALSLSVEAYRTEKTLACLVLKADTFTLSFIHSVSLTPVFDDYRIDKISRNTYRIVQTQERFIAHGQGLPSMEGEPDATAFIHRNGKFILKLQRPINDLIVRTDSRFKNRLHTGSLIFNLNQWADTGLRITPVNRCPPPS